MKTLILLPTVLVAALMPMTLSSDDVAADTSAAGIVNAPASGGVETKPWFVDSGHSICVFACKHADAAWFYGTFDRVEGVVSLDPADLGSSSVSLTIPIDSLDSNNKDRDGHLMSPDFFNAKENPEMTFKSKKIVADGNNLTVTGDLSMAGVTQTLTIPVEWTGDGEFRGKRRGYLAQFSVKRSDFGMNYGVAKKTLGDEVRLTISLELIQAK